MFTTQAQVNGIDASGLAGENVNNPTSLQFGPDDRLYVSQQNGTVWAFEIVRNGANDYQVVSTEQINIIKSEIPNYNDDGTLCSSCSSKRQITSLYVTGTATNPVLYVSSSDYRIGGGSGGSDTGLDTNSSTLSRLTWTGSEWDHIELIRGLPRSEENHSINGMQLDETSNTLYIAMGGFTNGGSPSNNFAFITEYAYSAAILTVDLDAIDALPTLIDDVSGNAYKYNMPTLDDPTRPNVNGIEDPNDNNWDGIDVGDPFGGNDGLNQAKIVTGSPVQIYSPGWRNPYDLVITEADEIYSVDNGGNQGWGGFPDGEGSSTCTNNWISGEPGSSNAHPSGEEGINNLDNLQFVSGLGYYGGHPTPTRGNPFGAGLFTHSTSGGGNDGVWRTTILDPNDPNFEAQSLPVDWPPVEVANPIECDFIRAEDPFDPDTYEPNTPNNDKGALATFGASTNGITEYTAGNLSGELQGDLLMASFNGTIYLYDLGTNTLDTFASGFGSTPLDVIAQSDFDIFPGTVWAATYGADDITVFEPADYDGGGFQCDGTDDNTIDEDNDGYTNADEIDNGTNPCSGAQVPADFDKTDDGSGFLVSDLNDPDDDNDGLLDTYDPYAIDATNGAGIGLPFELELFNGFPGYGFYGLGFTGLMTNGTPATPGSDYLTQYDDANIIAGGTAGLLSMLGDDGTAFAGSNDQLYGFQFGLDAGAITSPYTIEVILSAPYFVVSSGTPTDKYEGFYIGDGTQDNYLALVVDAAGNVRVIHEENGSVLGTSQTFAEGIDLGNASGIALYMTVNPTTNEVSTAYSVNSGTLTNVGTPITMTGNIAAAIDGTFTIDGVSSEMAVGVMATSNTTSDFTATWDNIAIDFGDGNTPSDLVVSDGVVEITDVDFGGVQETETSDPILVTLDNIGTLDPITITDIQITGTDASAFSVTPNTGTTLNTTDTYDLSIDFTPPSTGSFSASLEITHDGNNGPVTTLNLTGSGIGELNSTVLHRINVGGPQVATADATAPVWSEDTATNPSPFRVGGNDGIYTSSSGGAYSGPIVMTDPSLLNAPYAPATIFETERWDTLGKENMVWAFDSIPTGTTVQLRLYFAELWTGITAPGQRVFDVVVEGSIPPVFDDIDAFAIAGPNTGLMLEYQVVVNDGVLDFEFIHGVQNPALKAIEVAIAIENEPPVIDPLVDQSVAENDSLVVPISVSDADGDIPTVSVEVLDADTNVVDPTSFSYTFDSNTNQITFSPAIGTAGDYTVNVTADDNTGESNAVSTESFALTVTPVLSSALIQITETGDIDADTALANSFSITNTGDDAIVAVTFDLSTAVLPNLVFDPLGTTGDAAGSCLSPDVSAPDVGYITPAGGDCSVYDVAGAGLPYSDLNAGGYNQLGMSFTSGAFTNGETLQFSADIDPTIIESSITSGNAGVVSGLELIGTTVTVEFETGATQTTQIYTITTGTATPSQGGSVSNMTGDTPVNTLTLDVEGVILNNGIADLAYADPSLIVTGPPNATVSITQLNTGLLLTGTDQCGANPVPYEANVANNVVEYFVTLDATGQATVLVSLFGTAGDTTNGFNYFTATIVDDGATPRLSGDLSNTVMLSYPEYPNFAPLLNSTYIDTTMDEGSLLSLPLDACDVGTTDIPTFNVTITEQGSGSPASFFTVTENGDGTGSIDLAPTFADAGVYNVTVEATDGSLTSNQETFVLTVSDVNSLPVIDAIGNQTVAIGFSLDILVGSSDADGQIPSLSVAIAGVSDAGAFAYNFSDNADGTGTLNVTPQTGTSTGTYVVTVTANDGIDQTTLNFNLTVEPNPTPVIDVIADQTMTEDDTLNVDITATDDGTVSLGVQVLDKDGNLINISPLDDLYALTDNGDGTGTITFTTQSGDSASSPYTVLVSALDDYNNLGNETFTLNVGTQQAPIFDPIADVNILEGNTSAVTVSATDPEGQAVTYAPVGTLPAFVTWNGVDTFNIAPGAGTVGTYTITVEASDGLAQSQEMFDIVVVLNQAPTFDAAIADLDMTIGGTVSTNFSATDAEGDPITFSATMVDQDVNPVADFDFVYTLTDNADGTGSFDFTPSTDRAGSYTVTVIASDGNTSTDTTFAVNITPTLVITSPLDASVVNGNDITVTWESTGTFSNDHIHVSIDSEPYIGGQALDGSFTFTNVAPGTHTLTVELANFAHILYGVEDSITIDLQQQAPIFDAITNPTLVEGESTSVTVSATDPEGAGVTFDSPGTLPAFITWDGVNTFNIAPQTGDAGTYTIAVDASDAFSTTSTTFDVTVNPEVTGGNTVIHRINVGGPEVATADGTSPVWSEDTAANPSPYRVAGSDKIYNDTGWGAYDGPVDLTDPSLVTAPYAPAIIFATERFDTIGKQDMEWEFDNIPAGSTILVRLYFAELWSGITGPGGRVFDVAVEGNVPPVFDNIDAYALAGPNTGLMLEYQVVVNDSTLDVDFIHGTQNPALKGIEVIIVDG